MQIATYAHKIFDIAEQSEQYVYAEKVFDVRKEALKELKKYAETLTQGDTMKNKKLVPTGKMLWIKDLILHSDPSDQEKANFIKTMADWGYAYNDFKYVDQKLLDYASKSGCFVNWLVKYGYAEWEDIKLKFKPVTLNLFEPFTLNLKVNTTVMETGRE